MTRDRLGVGWAALGILVCADCGYIGNPLPPALDIPSQIVDLRAAEYGETILVEFTIPPLTTEGLPLKNLRSVDLYAGPANSPFEINSWAASAKRYSVPVTAPGPVAFDKIVARDFEGKAITIAVRATGPKGKTSAFSNLKNLAVGPALVTPAALKPENTKDGVRLTWSGSGPKYRIFRSSGNAEPAEIGQSDQPQYLDMGAQFGTDYRYVVQAIDGDSRQSVVSDSVSIKPKDEFAPAVPEGVTAAAGTNTIELAWIRNTEPDFRGYNIYRSTGDGPFEKIASLVEAPAYSDSSVKPGQSYRYAISSVDLIGNESARSEPVSASLP